MVSVYLKPTYLCTEDDCTEIDIYVPKLTVPIFCMYRKWLYRYWHSMYQNWMYRKNMYRKCIYWNCPVPKATYPQLYTLSKFFQLLLQSYTLVIKYTIINWIGNKFTENFKYVNKTLSSYFTLILLATFEAGAHPQKAAETASKQKLCHQKWHHTASEQQCHATVWSFTLYLNDNFLPACFPSAQQHQT